MIEDTEVRVSRILLITIKAQNLMSGICGFIDYNRNIDDRVLENMTKSLAHRGPHDYGTQSFFKAGAKVALGHTRMAVVDLNTVCRQPLTFAGLTIVMDGIVYNFGEIKQELEAKDHQFRSNTSSEVVLHSFKEWGQQCVDRFNGMFAFVIYDHSNHCLHMCRDRAGIKPLYYHQGNGFFAFASELKALMAMPQFKRDVSTEALSTYLKTMSIPGELSIFENTHKLDGGHWATLRIDTKELVKRQYWRLDNYYALPKLKISYDEAKDELKSLISSSLRYCLISDKPIGGLLSGGIDTSTVTSILSREVGITPTVFTIGFEDGHDEVPIAKQITNILDAHHFTRYCKEDDAIGLIQLMPQVYDEPSADPSAIPTQLACRFAKEHVPVVLSADGGDHLFAGFNWYELQDVLRDKVTRYEWIRGFHHLPIALAKSILPYHRILERTRLDLLSSVLDQKVINYKVLNESYKTKTQNMVNEIFPAGKPYDCREIYHTTGDTVASLPEYAQLLDFRFGMKDEILVKVERAAMSVSLECREPLLDHRIIEFAAQLPWEYKCHNGIKKRILRDTVYDYLPKELMNLPKHGFSPPTTIWMRGCLRTMIYDLLRKNALEEMGFSAPRTLKLLDYFMSRDNQPDYVPRTLWAIFQYCLWYNRWIKCD